MGNTMSSSLFIFISQEGAASPTAPEKALVRQFTDDAARLSEQLLIMAFANFLL